MWMWRPQEDYLHHSSTTGRILYARQTHANGVRAESGYRIIRRRKAAVARGGGNISRKQARDS